VGEDCGVVMQIERGEGVYRFVRVDGRYLFSPHDPWKEIERMFERMSLPEKPFFVLFGTAEGYVIEFLRKRGYDLVDLWWCDPVEAYTLQDGEMVLEADLAMRLEGAFMRQRRPIVVALEGYKRIFAREFEDFSRRYARILAQVVENIKVTAFFARLWWIHFVRHCRLASLRGVYRLPHERPCAESVVVTASGPSLMESLEDLRQWSARGGKILACLSSYATLREGGVRPWGVVVSDAGVANVLHGVGLERDVVVFASVYASSALTVFLENPLVFYDADEEGEKPSFVLARPSVVLDALEVAHRLFQGEVYVVGLDLAYQAHGTHPRSNMLQQLSVLSASRLRPVETQMVNFLGRGDIKPVAGAWTTTAFALVKNEVERRFPHVTVIRPVLAWKNPVRERLPQASVEKTPQEVVFVPFEGAEEALQKARAYLEREDAMVYLRESMGGGSQERVRSYLLDKYHAMNEREVMS